MLRKITLENFMSHAETVIELADGLTVLTGPNNCGKSAIVAALQILATNGRTTHVTRHGQKVCRVVVETDEGDCVVWERSGTTVKYNINGEDINRVGSSIPESLHDVLKLDRVEAKAGKSRHEYDIHFGEQKSPVFLINEPGSRSASFFASSSDAARLMEMQGRHRSRVRDKKAERKRLTVALEENVARLKTFEPVDAIDDDLCRAEALHQTSQVRRERIEHLRLLIDSIESKRSEINVQREVISTLSRLDCAKTTPSAMLKARDQETQLDHSIKTIEGIQRQNHFTRRILTALAKLKSVPPQFPLQPLDVLIQAYCTAIRVRVRLQRENTILRSLTPLPKFKPADACRRLWLSLGDSLELKDRCQALSDTLGRLVSVPEFYPTRRLRKLIDTVVRVGGAREQVRNVNQAILHLKPSPEVLGTHRLEEAAESISRCQSNVKSASFRTDLLEKLEESPDPEDVGKLSMLVKRLEDSIKRSKTAKSKASNANKLLRRSEESIRSFVSANPKCLVCGADIDPKTLMAASAHLHIHHHTDIHAEDAT